MKKKSLGLIFRKNKKSGPLHMLRPILNVLVLGTKYVPTAYISVSRYIQVPKVCTA